MKFGLLRFVLEGLSTLQFNANYATLQFEIRYLIEGMLSHVS